MPIFADIRPSVPTQPPAGPPVDGRRLEFVSLSGQEVISWTGDEWIAKTGATGLDIPPRRGDITPVPGLDGGRWGEITDDVREVFLPLWVRALDGDHRTVLARMALLRRLLDYRGVDHQSAEGTFDLVAVGGGERRSLRCAYREGLSGDYGSDAMFPSWLIFGLRLSAANPHWRGKEWSTPVVSTPITSPFLSDDPADAWPRMLAPTVALGTDMQVRVGGDIPSPPVIEIVGPATTTHVTSPQGLDVSVGAVAAGQTLLIDTGRSPGRRKQALLNGSPAWPLVGDSPRWQALPPGDALISVVLTGATGATSARVYGTELWETAW